MWEKFPYTGTLNPKLISNREEKEVGEKKKLDMMKNLLLAGKIIKY